MLNNIKISQTLQEIVLNINVVADLPEILEELDVKIPKLKSFYKTSKLPMKITGKLFTSNLRTASAPKSSYAIISAFLTH